MDFKKLLNFAIIFICWMYYTVRIIQNIMHRIKYNRMENSINGSRYKLILRQRGGCARGYARVPPTPHSSPPPPPPLLHRVAAKQHCTNFTKHKILTKLFWISRNFTKFQVNFVKYKIKYIVKILLLLLLHSNASLRWSRYMHRSFPLCHL